MTCAKTTVRCTIVTTAGEHIVGTNACAKPQEVCPRLPGEDYQKCDTVCGQMGHAEQQAVRAAGARARGGHAWIEGHTYACMECQHALFGAGVRALSIGAPPPTREESAMRKIADQMGWSLNDSPRQVTERSQAHGATTVNGEATPASSEHDEQTSSSISPQSVPGRLS